jgi:phosphoadenosine phosphosulfate reductase
MHEQVANIKENLEAKDTLDTLRYLTQSGLKCAFSSSLGQEDQVLTHMIASEKLPVQIFTLDTGRLFPETYELIDKTTRELDVDIKVIFPDSHQVSELVESQGVNGFYNSIENRKACCGVRKIEPLKKALHGVDVWITGLRSGQSANRQELAVIEWDITFQLIKVNPLINWSYDEVIAHLHDNDVPYNSLHDKGFKSIGCAPCTRAIAEDEDDRAGRWWWENSKKECGLHQHK